MYIPIFVLSIMRAWFRTSASRREWLNLLYRLARSWTLLVLNYRYTFLFLQKRFGWFKIQDINGFIESCRFFLFSFHSKLCDASMDYSYYSGLFRQFCLRSFEWLASSVVNISSFWSFRSILVDLFYNLVFVVLYNRKIACKVLYV